MLAAATVKSNRVVKPSYTTAVTPLTLFLPRLLYIVEDSDSVLFIVEPCSDVLVSIREHHSSLTTAIPVFKVSSVVAAIFQGKFAFAVELIVSKIAFVCFLRVSEVINSKA